VVAKNGCTILSQARLFPSSTIPNLANPSIVAKDFLNGPNGHLNFGSDTYVIQIEGMGIRKMRKYESGFKYFNFSNVQST
jgi:hypothetical protein